MKTEWKSMAHNHLYLFGYNDEPRSDIKDKRSVYEEKCLSTITL